MNNYELVFIARTDLDESATAELVERVKSWITDGGGEIAKVEQWGKRRLAYRIRKQIEGQYFFFDFSMPPTLSAQLERNLRFLEPVIRYLITQK